MQHSSPTPAADSAHGSNPDGNFGNINSKTAPHNVAIVGASGLVGHALIKILLADPAIRDIHLLLRQPLAELPADSRLHQHYVDFANPDSWHSLLAVDAVFCTLGTTIKKAGSPAAFRAVDLDLVVAVATAAKRVGATRFLVVSALGASLDSAVFYNRTKAAMEAALIGLELPLLSIFRPSLLSGPRREFRLGERLALLLAWLLPPPWRSIRDTSVARAMWRACRDQREPLGIYESAEMQRLGSELNV